MIPLDTSFLVQSRNHETGEIVSANESSKFGSGFSSETEARNIIRAGLQTWLEFNQAPSNHGFPGQLGVFILDNKDNLPEETRRLLQKETITSIFKEELTKLAEENFASLSIAKKAELLDSDSEGDDDSDPEVFDSIRNGPVSNTCNQAMLAMIDCYETLLTLWHPGAT
jgi:hypothetical protein